MRNVTVADLIENTPEGIVAGEKRGSVAAAKAQQLPKDGTSGAYRAQWEALGFVFDDTQDDKLFTKAVFPDGWKIKHEPSDYRGWILVDDKGRKRGSGFVKLTSYDSYASIQLTMRYSVNPYHADGVTAMDGDKVLKNFGQVAERDYEKRDALAADAVKWMNENYPEWKSASAYWD